MSMTAMSIPMFLDYLAVLLKGPEAAGKHYQFNVEFTDVRERYLLEVENGVLNHTAGVRVDDPTASLSLERSSLDAIVLGEAEFVDLLANGRATVEGDTDAFKDFVQMLDSFEFWFDIVTP